MPNQLSELLRELRKLAGLTQEELARRSGVSERTIRRLETGAATDHRLATVNMLADVLGITAEQRRLLAAALTGDESVVEPVPPPEVSVSVPCGLLAEAARELARSVRRQWRREEGRRRVHDPFTLPVRWRALPAALADHPENVQRLAPGAVLQRLDLQADVTRVVEVYRKIVSGRMVVLGRAGSGKSVLAIRFVLDLLDAEPVPRRVPVLFSFGSWDPSAVELGDWLADQLLRDHPHLARRTPGGSPLAAALVEAELILPVLDGFDEIAPGLREDALKALNETAYPLLVTSRREQFAAAVEAAHASLAGAAGVELEDLTVDDLAAYLPRTGRAGRSWAGVLDALREQESPAAIRLARTLSTPLMVDLARTMCSDVPGRDPADLLCFPTREALEEHLLAGFVPAVYRRRIRRPGADAHGRGREAERVRRWLGHLAQHLARSRHHRQNLAWWQLGESLRHSSRVLAVAVATGLCVAAAAWAVGLFTSGLGAWEVLRTGALVGLLAGVVFGAVHAAVIIRRDGALFEPSRMRLRLPGGRGVAGGPGRAPVLGLRDGLIGGFALGGGYACALSVERVVRTGVRPTVHLAEGTLVDLFLFGLIFSVAGGLVLAAVSLLEAPVDVDFHTTPANLLAANRAMVLRQVALLAPLLTLAIALGGFPVSAVFRNLFGPLAWSLADGLSIGAVGGIGGAVCYALAFTAWGQWLLLVRVWLPLTGRLPWDTLAFLEEAHRCGVLHRTGAVHQFRHIRLQHHLAVGDARPPGRSRPGEES